MVRIAKGAVVLFGVMHLAAADAATPAWCDDTLVRESGKSTLATRYQVRQNGKYCEGVVPRLNAGGLELVGYQQGTPAIGSKSDLTIGLANDVRQAFRGKGRVQVVGVDWSGEHSYRFDASIEDSNVDLSTANVIGPLNLARDRVSFLAWTTTGLDKLFMPVDFGGTSKELKAKFVSPVSYRKISAAVIEAGTSAKLQPDVVLEDVKERSLITIWIEPSAVARTVVLKLVCWDYTRDTVADGLVATVYVPARR